jgi:hypothetical protein
MLRIEMSQVVNRPVEDVWNVVTNFDNWSLAGREFRQISAGAMGVRATVESRRTILGRTLKLNHIVITEWGPIAPSHRPTKPQVCGAYPCVSRSSPSRRGRA